MSALVRNLLSEYYELREAVLTYSGYTSERLYWKCEECNRFRWEEYQKKLLDGRIYKVCPICEGKLVVLEIPLQTYTLEKDLIRNIDIDRAIEHLKDTFTEKEWETVDLLAQGYKTTDIPEMLQISRGRIYKIFRKVSESIVNYLGHEYSDGELKRMIKYKLKVKTLTKTQNEFIKRKLNMSEQHRKTFDFITIYNVRFDDTGRMGAFCPECKKFAVAKKFMCVHMKRGER